MSATQLQSMAPQHHALVDFIIENAHEQGWREKACTQFGVTYSYLSIVWRSDVFREAFNKRLTEWRGGVTRELQAKQIAVAQAAYTRLIQMLGDKETDDRLVLDIANSTMKNLGFAPSPGASPQYLKESEITRSETRVLAPGILETARTTYRKVTTGEQLPEAVGE